MVLLISTKDNKTKYQLCQFTNYEVGDITSNGWYVIDKGVYYKGTFISYKELKKEYWENYKIRSRYKKNLYKELFYRIFKK